MMARQSANPESWSNLGKGGIKKKGKEGESGPCGQKVNHVAN